MRILAFDPSGNWGKEGDGTTGFAVLSTDEADNVEELDYIRAKDFYSPEAYWDAVTHIIDVVQPDAVVYETYRLQATKAQAQSWSQMETPQLIGCIRLKCYHMELTCIGQDPSIKPRFSDSVLLNMGIAVKHNGLLYIKGKKTNNHQRDALRHGLYYLKYGRK